MSTDALPATGLPKLWQRDLHAVVVLRVADSLSPRVFARQLSVLTAIGRVVSLDDVREARGLGRINFVLLLSHPTSRIAALIDVLAAKSLPAALSVFAAGDGGQSRGAGAHALTLDEIAQIVSGQRLLSVVNHGEHWHPLDVLGHIAVMEDIARSTDRCARAFSQAPDYYAVPYGNPTATLAVDVIEALRERHYRGALWALAGANLVRGPSGHRVMSLGWTDAPASVGALLVALTSALRRSHEGTMSALPAGERETEWAIALGGPPDRALAFDNVMRESREYASNPEVYDYQFTRNPYKGARPDYHAVTAGGRVTSIGYNFHARCVLDGRSLDAVYWSSWRKLAASPHAASALLLAQAVSSETIVGAYHPSASAQQALRARSWKQVRVVVCTLQPGSSFTQHTTPAADVSEHERYPAAIDALVARARATHRFSIDRTPEFYRWRFDQYPLAEPRYFVLSVGGTNEAYAVTLRRAGIMSVADFFAPSAERFQMLLERIIEYCRAHAIGALTVETSLPEIVQLLRGRRDVTSVDALNFYHFNAARLRRAGLQPPLETWETMTFHETQASGDVLLR